MVDIYILTKKKHTYHTYKHTWISLRWKGRYRELEEGLSSTCTPLLEHDHIDTACMCKAVRVTLRCREDDRSIETIHTHIHSSLYLISGSEGMGWNAYPKAVWQRLHCCGMAQYWEVIRDNGAAAEKTIDPWWLPTGTQSEHVQCMPYTHTNANHPVWAWRCVTLPSTVWYTRGGKIIITNLPSSYLTIYQLAYIHSGIPTMKTCCSIFYPSLVIPFPAIDLFIAVRRSPIGMDGEIPINNHHNEYIHTYIHMYIQKQPYIPLHRVATPDEVRTDRDIQRRFLISITSLSWQPSHIHTVSSHALQWAM
jgi:hypothetical protein